MKPRPLSVTIIGWLFIAAGAIGLAYHVTELRRPFEYDVVWVCFLRLLAILGGVFVLSGHNWARWLLVIWIAYHVVLSGSHSLSGVITHALLLVVVTYFLFRPQATSYFQREI
ncbi:MAG TPA: hypothetical protein VFH31_04700 [Pyrinomonadaceae bacterium]|nr:hypothetical protein [Pyrinomonadaceae bacterium]